jgi:phosphomethylpyrimidine synthase
MAKLIKELKQGRIPEYIGAVAQEEGVDRDELIRDVIRGHVVIPRNNRRAEFRPIAIGRGTRIKVNANIGTSPLRCDFQEEMEKVGAAADRGADTVMDLSISGDIAGFRGKIASEVGAPLGTVPLYEAMIGLESAGELTVERFLEVVERQAREKVDFMTIHAGLLRRHIPFAEKRVLGVVSRGGSIMVDWMRRHGTESFLYEHFDEILAIAGEYDVALSLGDGLRPGCGADANDAAQFGELETIGELVRRCREADVQVMVEGPGHVPLHLIEENVRREKEVCDGAPFYLLGPLVIDYAAGYDHIAGAIGGALAAWFGADFLCYLTPAEHLRLPTIEDVREGVVASKIAAAAVDMARGRPAEIRRSLEMSKARNDFDWDAQRRFAIDPSRFCKYLEKEDMDTSGEIACSMCGEWCAIRRTRKGPR